MDTYDIVDAQISGVGAREGVTVNVGPGKPVSMGVVLGANEGTVALASADCQSKGGGEECQGGGSNDSGEDHV